MKKYLLIILLFVCVCLTGCTVDYDIEFDKDLKVKEIITVMTPHSDIEKYLKYQTRDEFINGVYQNSSYYEDENATFKDRSKTGYVIGEISTSYDDISSFVKNSQAIHEMFANISSSEADNKIYIDLKNFFPLSATTSTRGPIDEIKVTITSPYQLKGFNTSTCSIENEYYVCSFTFTQKTKINGLSFYIDKDFTTTKTVAIYAISGIIIFVLFGSFIYIKMKKINKI